MLRGRSKERVKVKMQKRMVVTVQGQKQKDGARA